MSETRKIESLSVDDIVIPEGRRELQDDRVEDLAVSMQLIGLRHPIAVRFKDDKPHLVDGLHRLRAVPGAGEFGAQDSSSDDFLRLGN